MFQVINLPRVHFVVAPALGVQVSVRLSVCPSVYPSVNIYPGCLVSVTPLTVLYQSFWNFGGVFIMVWGCACGLDIIVRLFFVTFSTWPQCIDSGYLVSQTPQTILYRSFWNFVHVFSMVWRCACGLDVILALIFVTFPLWELCHFLTSDSMKVLWQWVPCECSTSYNFIPIFLKLCTCFPHGLEMCMWFGYNLWKNFYHFFHFVIFWPQILWKCRDSGYLVSATPPTILYRPLWNFAHVFLPWSGDVHVVWI